MFRGGGWHLVPLSAVSLNSTVITIIILTHTISFAEKYLDLDGCLSNNYWIIWFQINPKIYFNLYFFIKSRLSVQYDSRVNTYWCVVLSTGTFCYIFPQTAVYQSSNRFWCFHCHLDLCLFLPIILYSYWFNFSVNQFLNLFLT